MSCPFSEKQVHSFKNSNSRINIWEGSVRSGKTFISVIRFIEAMRNGPKGNVMIIGVSRDSIQRNVLIELCSFLSFPIPTPKATQMNAFGRIIFLIGANDERAQKRIHGSTIALAYVDELTLIPQGFFKMLLSRLSVTGAQLFGTTNPDSPFHWLKTDVIDNVSIDMSKFKFTIDDNPSLSSDYIKNLKAEYTGLWYKRFIEGQWVLAEGTVYDFFDESDHVIALPPGIADYYIVGIDYGTHNPTAFTMVGYNSRLYPNMWLEKEYFYDSEKKQRQKTDTEYSEDLSSFCKGYNVKCVYIDPSALSLKIEMVRYGISHLFDADNDVLNGIRFVSKLLSNGTFKVCSNCKNIIQEFGTYRWDDKAARNGEDKAIKKNDHALDSLRYALYSRFGKKYAEDIQAKEIDTMWNNARGINQDLPEFFRGNQLTPVNQQFAGFR